MNIAIKVIIICFICLNMWVNIMVLLLAIKSGPQIATKTGKAAGLLFAESGIPSEIWGARDNGILPNMHNVYMY